MRSSARAGAVHLIPSAKTLFKMLKEKKELQKLPAVVSTHSSSGVINPPPTRVLVKPLFPQDFCWLISVLGDSEFKSFPFAVRGNGVEQR